MSSSPTFADVQAAARRLDGVTLRTPLLENARVNALLGGRLFIKAECLQRTGSFKLRGAYNFLSQMSEVDRKKLDVLDPSFPLILTVRACKGV